MGVLCAYTKAQYFRVRENVHIGFGLTELTSPNPTVK
jgi:hypothetical protein